VSELAIRYFTKALERVKARDYDQALVLLVEAIKLKPDFCEAWVVRGNVLHAMERPFDALLHFDRAISINEQLHDAWNNRGICFADLGLWAGAEESFRTSAELCPSIEPHMGLANMFCTLNRLDEAASEYRKAIEYDPGSPEAHFNLGVTLLGQGKWDEGFPEYEWRWRNTPYPPRAFRDYPKWTGQDLSHKQILLYGEQGYGDEIMALRFALAVANRYAYANVVVQARAPMLRLARTLCPYAPQRRWAMKFVVPPLMVVDPDFDPFPGKYDFSCPLLDVPMVLGLTPDRVSCSVEGAYLEAVREKVDEWTKRLAALPAGLNVGLCWYSGGHLGTARAAQAAKSIPLHWLKPLDMPGVNLVSLQKDKPEPWAGRSFAMSDWMDECHDFADTAALIDALDLVISVDTAVAHLAGALGKPVWNLVRFSGYWPWLSPEAAKDPELSIWYPDMTLVRQPSLANWQEPIERITSWLTTIVRERAAVRESFAQ
jgi:Tfp pilus assembly protein PilF